MSPIDEARSIYIKKMWTADHSFRSWQWLSGEILHSFIGSENLSRNVKRVMFNTYRHTVTQEVERV